MKQEVILITGPQGSGKTQLARALELHLGGMYPHNRLPKMAHVHDEVPDLGIAKAIVASFNRSWSHEDTHIFCVQSDIQLTWPGFATQVIHVRRAV